MLILDRVCFDLCLTTGVLQMWNTNKRKMSALLAVVLTGSLSACGKQEPDPERVASWREDYCSDLSTWQRITHDPPEKGYGNEPVLTAAAVISAAKVIDREHLDHAGSHILYDTSQAVSHNDQDAEKRVSEYCAAVGFETLMKYL
ncbi:hypothetical protein ABTX77_41155 [Streptomyces sp. NPDC097704]|uniref:hypothetical protein n=1 Tax=Streptomyces sp. NPDC097704 TaxID=3157101 RepID=UPI00332EC855